MGQQQKWLLSFPLSSPLRTAQGWVVQSYVGGTCSE